MLHRKIGLLLMLAATNVMGRPQTTLVTTVPPSSVRPISTTTTQGFVADSFEDLEGVQPKPIITKVDIRSDIQFRYAKTVVKSFIKNPSVKIGQDVQFVMVMPDSAFISNFTIQLVGDDTVYVAKVEKKEDAKKAYEEAVEQGQSAGLVDTDTRDASQVRVSANVEAGGKMEFTLTYEELLERHNSKYEHVIHVNPGQVVKDYNVNVYINESLPVVRVSVPELKTDPNAITSKLKENQVAQIESLVDSDPRKVHISFQPDTTYQSLVDKAGMNGQFIVQYDVDRKEGGNEVQVLDGYFVHFFAPEDLTTLPRHVVFVLDVSGSMSGTKLQQTKDAMVTILDDMTDQDYFNILTFSDEVYHWVSAAEQLKESPHNLTYRATEENRREALKYVLDLSTIGGTNIHDSLVEAVELVRNVKQAEILPSFLKPIVIFLTDGQATTGITGDAAIRRDVKAANTEEVPIYGLAFGEGADFNLIKTISLENDAFARKIYEASDAAIQLEDFYQDIASPLINNLNFTYVGEAIKNKTSTDFKTFFKGTEYIIAGKIDNIETDEEIEIIVQGDGKNTDYMRRIPICWLKPHPVPHPEEPIALPVEITDGPTSDVVQELSIRPPPPPCFPWPQVPEVPKEPRSEAENFIERLWAYLTIKNLLEDKLDVKIDKDIVPDTTSTTTTSTTTEPDYVFDEVIVEDESEKPKTKTRREKALELALRYNFVTELTSLIVVRPDQEDVLADQEEVCTSCHPFRGGNFFAKRVPAVAGAFHFANRVSVQNAPAPVFALAGPSGRPHPTQMFPRTSTFPTTTTFSAIAYDSFYDLNGFDYGSSSEESSDEENATEPDLSDAVCIIKLYPKTYLRGDSFVLNKTEAESVEDLGDVDFDNKLTSLSVTGPCCWQIFTEPDFKGESKEFSEGEYESAGQMGHLFREASSLKMVPC